MAHRESSDRGLICCVISAWDVVPRASRVTGALGFWARSASVPPRTTEQRLLVFTRFQCVCRRCRSPRIPGEEGAGRDLNAEDSNTLANAVNHRALYGNKFPEGVAKIPGDV